jgi:hypothetical protein
VCNLSLLTIALTPAGGVLVVGGNAKMPWSYVGVDFFQ